jgi:hypothetical protein
MNFETSKFESLKIESLKFQTLKFEISIFVSSVSFNYSKSRRKHLTGVYFLVINNYINLNIDFTSSNRRRRYQYWALNGLSVILLLRLFSSFW